eukprot:TRINITY_DN348_c0_g1_i15.p1 TRINITY_DN348_c0_g1~~TRINITY_DN348_c0_g1_i15.p1  ORF type:complete len:225 (+),score=59.70 TRINITY_DN348_c0_g1_i15:452-1126(+)
MQMVLHKFGYEVTEDEARWILSSFDLNKDGNISFDEFRYGMQAFCMTRPRMITPGKMPKPYHQVGYNWTAHPDFPQRLAYLWRPVGGMTMQAGMGYPQQPGMQVQMQVGMQPGGMGMQAGMGYPQQPGMQPGMGYPQQPGMQPGMGYPQQPGMQPGYPQQGYPQQGMQPGMQPGYPQQGMQPGMQPGYPQQGMQPGMQPGYPQQGYPQQGMQPGYPQQGYPPSQ